MNIEQCGFDDLPVGMVRQARREGADLDQTLKSPWVFFRTVWEMETVGFVGVLCRTPTIVNIRGWYVKPEYRGQGIGTRLLVAAMNYAIDQRIDKIEIRTTKSRVVHRLGFEWTGYQRRGGKQERHYVRIKGGGPS